ncbi:MAG: hypothetical protein U1E41_04570 [Paracoccus sp. (in: a-proteobacteria)]|jgi:hypothetical protein
MASYAISFRIAEQGNADERRASLVDKVNEISTVVTWDETTSFILIKSFLSAEQVASKIYLESSMRQDIDKLLVVRVDGDAYSHRGDIKHPARLGSFFA